MPACAARDSLRFQYIQYWQLRGVLIGVFPGRVRRPPAAVSTPELAWACCAAWCTGGGRSIQLLHEPCLQTERGLLVYNRQRPPLARGARA